MGGFLNLPSKRFKLEPGDLVVCKLDKECYSDKPLTKDYLTWVELRNKILSGEVCIIIEAEEKNHASNLHRIKILDSRGQVGWAFSHHFLKVST
jgi:hypothetical protein